MNKWPINTMLCDHEGCDCADTTPYYYTLYQWDIMLRQVLFQYGIKQAWQFWRYGWIDVLDGYYCPEHAKEEGFCYGCGKFYMGFSEHFDFEIEGQKLCDECWENYQAEIQKIDKEDEEYWERFSGI